MKNSVLITVVFALALAPCLNAQINRPRNDSFNELLFFVGTNTIKYDETEGSPYLYEDFLPAQINNIKETKMVRFNAVENVIEVKQGENILGLTMSKAYSVKLRDGSERIFEIHPVETENGKQEKVFLEKVFSNDKFMLYMKENIRYVEAKPAKSSYDQPIPAKFVKNKNSFYLIEQDSEGQKLVLLPKKKKTLIKTFGDKGKTIDKKIKKEGLKLNEKNDMVTILSYYYNL
ncbi:hypothetical protein [Poritiphilus flavus]|uniref:Uncharacterized protein n=1 Tax=Poritiphilus flavus TaxID=2697053 RepID=A0A6L9E964_9FLAO|nr:hypothetical protein [Poritiphilus flavus]NAS11173.1 hypothetical protein [Poritiphilus flavus]